MGVTMDTRIPIYIMMERQGLRRYEIKPDDAGRVIDLLYFGRVRAGDIGKLLVISGGLLYMENEEQRTRRKAIAAMRKGV